MRCTETDERQSRSNMTPAVAGEGVRCMRWVWLLLVALAVPVSAQDAEQRAAWNRPFAPFRIIGNVHYVGTAGLSSFLITGPAGHVLIDGGLPESAPLIAANIRALGFRLADVKYLLINHSHADHAGGLAELKRLTGATLLASASDAPDLAAGKTIGRADVPEFPAVKVDAVVRDGARVVLGPIKLTAMLTPGHTRGATSWTMTVAGRRVLFASSLSVAGQPLLANRAYPQAAGDFRRTFARLRAAKADMFLNYHAEGFDLAAKRARQIAGDGDAFVNPAELQRQVAAAEQAFVAALAEQTR